MHPSFARGKAVCLLLLAVLLALPGCSAPPPPPVTTLEGNDPNGLPPPSPQEVLANLVNAYRVANGQSSLVMDPLVQKVAQEHTEYMASIGQLTPIMYGRDFTQRLLMLGLPPGPTGTAAAYLARGYSDPQMLMDAMAAQNRILLGNYTRLGVGMANPGNGNYWTVLFY
ncbi:MAG: CAP domain-containing protein [Planctomycetes bacterium]|nr:CAP domain-containing protein [Planctomycetota bacterium]